MRKIKNSRSLKVLSAALLGVAALGAPAVAETVTVTPDMDGTELSNLNQLQTDEVRNFNFNSSEETYTVTKNLGTSTAGEININGIIGETAKSVIDFGGNTNGFVINGDTTLNISNIEFKNASTVYGSVLKINKGTVNLTNVDFTNNVSESSTRNVTGGVIYNYTTGGGKASIGAISGNFTNNSAIGKGESQAVGGAIQNRANSIIGDINANFTENYVKTNSGNCFGSAIVNYGTSLDDIAVIGNIQGNFLNNYSESVSGDTVGVIMNQKAIINSISGYFEGNYAISGGRISAGAINNNDHSIITEGITANFKDNYSKTTGTGALARGGAVLNFGYIKHITGDFDGNYAESAGTGAFGGAIANMYGNDGSLGIEKISGNYTNNHAEATGSGYAYGGAIYNCDVTIGTTDSDGNVVGGIINSNFTGNYVQTKSGLAMGGAINNDKGTIGDIKANFIDNYAKTTSNNAFGGAIMNFALDTMTSKIGDITGNFTANYVESESRQSNGGAIYNFANDGGVVEIGNITGNFINNYAKNNGSNLAYGGAINNCGKPLGGSAIIGNISGNFIHNYAQSMNGDASSGALGNLYNGTINSIRGYFEGNYTLSGGRASGGAIDNNANSVITEGITANFKDNYAKSTGTGALARGGAVLNFGYIKHITGDFDGNYAESAGTGAIGGAIANMYGNEGSLGIDKISGNYTNNHAEATGSGYAYGGAIYNCDVTIGTTDSDGNVVGGIINSNFIGNYAKSIEGEAQGGAIYTTTDLNIIADGATSTFKDNYTQTGKTKDDNAIYIANAGATLNFQLKNNGQIAMYDNIRGVDGYKVNIQGDDLNATTFHLFNDMYNADLLLGNTTINTVNNNVHVYNVNNLTLNSDTNFVADVDIVNQTMDRFTADTYGEHSGNLHVTGLNVINPTPITRDTTKIYFAQPGLKDKVISDVDGITVSTPIFNYKAKYTNLDDAGYYLFTKAGSSSGNASDAFNPAILSTPITAQAGAQASMTETFRYVFEHADAFTQLPSVERLSHINANQYALSTDYNNNLGPIATEFNNKAGWFRPYVTFENMNLKNGPKVDAVTYGSLVGFDSDFQNLGKGWSGLTTGYIGYNGSQLNYKGVDTTMNGGVLGLTQTFYKGNFWSALTLSAGASVGQTSTMYGKEDFTSLLAGVGSKTGYNFEFKQGKFIVQPIMFMSYTFVNTFDYTNAAGVKINSDPMHTIQLNPSVRFIANTKTGWQPYASVGMVWNLLNETNATANGVKLPEMSMKPYVEYGLGVQKRFKDKYTAFGQAMIRNGGRNGIALTFGFRWSLGKDSKPIEKVNNETLKQVQGDKGVNVNTLSKGEGRVRVQSAQPAVSTRTELENRHSELVSESQSIQQTNNTTNLGGKVPAVASRTVLKQLTPTQKTALGAKPQNTTKTTNSAILKQL